MSHARRALVAVAAGLTLLAACTTRVGEEPDERNPTSTQADTPRFAPSEDNPDPSKDIEGVVVTEYDPVHAEPGQRVAYDKTPPYGGRHDPSWADCTGIVYPEPVRNENMVHALEHGAVWIAYDPARVSGAELDELADRVEGQPYLMLSPYPDLDEPVSLQSWGHQLKVDSAGDERIDQFITALRDNPYTTPERGAPCDATGTQFDVADPPPFDPSPPGPDAAPVDGP